jgi:hypothetical protein
MCIGQAKRSFLGENMMTKTSFAAVICILAALPFAPLAQAQQCPAGLTNPLQLIDGTTWSFHLESPAFSSANAAVGIFKASFVPTNPLSGVLTIRETVNQNGSQLTRLATVSGRYQIYPDCSGGELLFMLGTQPLQLEFVFGQNFSLMRLLTDGDASTQFSSAFSFQVLSGEAKRF